MFSVPDPRSGADVGRPPRPPAPTPEWPPPAVTDLPLDVLLPRLEGVVESSAGQYWARCPAHADTRPSLSVCETDEHKVLVFCHAGCSAREVLEVVGLKLCHLFPSAYALWYVGRHGRRALGPRSAPIYPSARAVVVEDTPAPDLSAIAEAAYRAAEELGRHPLAVQLGVLNITLRALGVGVVVRPNGCWWTFPERDNGGSVVGLLLRHAVHQTKSSLTGSRRGLCLPSAQPAAPAGVPFVITEGATDLAALLGRGVPGVGRPAARPSGSVLGWLAAWLRAHPSAWAGRLFLVAGDNDEAGRAGAEHTALALRAVVPWVATAFPVPAFKDFRGWIQSGTFDPSKILIHNPLTNEST